MNIIRKTIIDDEKFLRQRSIEVDFNDKSYFDDISSLKEYCHKDGIFALAPVQIGIPKRIIYVRSSSLDGDKVNDSSYDESKVLINPVITKRIGLTRCLESCESCPESLPQDVVSDRDIRYLSCLVYRPYAIDVEYYDINGNKKTETFTQFKATVISHEYDHLNGILHIDLSKEVWPMNYNERMQCRSQNPYLVISEDCDFENAKDGIIISDSGQITQ